MSGSALQSSSEETPPLKLPHIRWHQAQHLQEQGPAQSWSGKGITLSTGDRSCLTSPAVPGLLPLAVHSWPRAAEDLDGCHCRHWVKWCPVLIHMWYPIYIPGIKALAYKFCFTGGYYVLK